MEQSTRWKRVGPAILLLGASSPPQPAQAQLQWKSADEKMIFKIGLLGQLQGESIDVAGNDDTAQNLFLRRVRVLMGGRSRERHVLLRDRQPEPREGRRAARR